MALIKKTGSIRLFSLLLAAALATALPAGSQVPFTSSEGGYSIVFPVQPKDQPSTGYRSKTALHIAVDDKALFIAGDTIYEDEMNVEQELKADVDNFIKAISGAKLTAQKRGEFLAASGDMLPAIEYSMDADRMTGNGVVVVTGSHTVCLFFAAALKPADRRAAIDRFLASAKIEKRKP